MTEQEKDRIQSAIETLKLMQSQVEWDYPMDYAVAVDMAIEALQKRIPEKPMISVDVDAKNLYYLYCPTCGILVGRGNKRLKTVDIYNKINKRVCGMCGQAIDWMVE